MTEHEEGTAGKRDYLKKQKVQENMSLKAVKFPERKTSLLQRYPMRNENVYTLNLINRFYRLVKKISVIEYKLVAVC